MFIEICAWRLESEVRMSNQIHIQEGILNSDYLASALSRAGLTSSFRRPETQALTGGRTGAAVTQLTLENYPSTERFVLKILPAHTWRDEMMDAHAGGEALLWFRGVTQKLPPPISCPMIDVSCDHEGAWWMLLRDISRGIKPRGAFCMQDEQVFVEALACLHAFFWQHPSLASYPLATPMGCTELFAQGFLSLAMDGNAAPPSGIRQFLTEIEPFGLLYPKLIRSLSKSDLEWLVSLAGNRSWERFLSLGPETLLHGDLRRANISFMSSDHISLINWEFAARGPVAVDLAWHVYLHCWVYPSEDIDPERSEKLLLQSYLKALSQLDVELDSDLFELQWKSAWLRVLLQLGFCLADRDDPNLTARMLTRARGYLRELGG